MKLHVPRVVTKRNDDVIHNHYYGEDDVIKEADDVVSKTISYILQY